MKKEIFYLGFAIVIGSSIFLGGCQGQTSAKVSSQSSQSHPNGTEANSNQHGYLYTSSGFLMYMQWTEVDKQLSGQFQAVYETGNPPKIQNQTHPFEGLHNGTDVSITFSESTLTDSLSGITWTGTLKAGQLSLVIPNKNTGGLDTYQFQSGTVTDYNNALEGLKQQVQNQVQQVAAQQAQAEVEKNKEKLANALNDDMSSLSESVKQLTSDTKFDDIFSSYSNHWSKMQADNQHLQQDASVQPLTDVKIGTCQVDLGTLETDQGSIETDDGSMEVRQNTINNYISSVREDINSVQKDWQAVSLAGASTTYNQNDIVSAITNAHNQVDASTTALQKAQAQATSYDSQVFQLLKTASDFVSGLKPSD